MFLSVSVAVTLGRRLVQWTIIDIQHNDRSFLDLFNEVKAGKFDCIKVIDQLAQATLQHVFVGKDKDKTMMTSAHHSVFSICKEFGKYVKFVVEVGGGGGAATSSRSVASSQPNAFSLMAIAQRQLQNADNGVPFTISVRTSKDKLFNDLVRLMKELGVKWLDPNAFVTPFLKLCEILWYLDSHHSTLSEHAPKVPTLFSRFNGYNCPEKHKHRKRALTEFAVFSASFTHLDTSRHVVGKLVQESLLLH